MPMMLTRPQRNNIDDIVPVGCSQGSETNVSERALTNQNTAVYAQIEVDGP